MRSLIWLSRIFLFLAALLSVLIDLRPLWWLEETISLISLPLFIILGISWIAPLVGGILALITVPVWFYWLGISNQHWALALSVCVGLTLGGIFSILVSRRQLAVISTNKLGNYSYTWLLWLSRLLIIATAYASIGYSLDFNHVTSDQVYFALAMLISLGVIWKWPLYGSIFILIWVPLYYYWLTLQMPPYYPGGGIIPPGYRGIPPLVKLEMVSSIGGAVLSLIWSWLNRKRGYQSKTGTEN